IGFVPEDRSTDGVIGTFTISENMILDLYDQAPYATGMSMQPAVVRSEGEKKVGEFDIRLTSIDDPISTLSGGNQQKVVLSRELGRPLRLLIASQPTRGLDVGSIEFVHKRIIAERDSGTPCVIVSTELDEVFNIADRIAVMYRGRVVGIVPAGTPRDVLGLMMAGVPEDEALARVEDGSAATEISASEEDPA
ncbi:MAG: heme ABC transporter ATP-binding protein, partial [Brevibacterium yomogidense]